MTSETVAPVRHTRDQVAAPHSAIPLRPILLRAAVVALVIGSVLTLINQASALFGAARLDVLPFIQVYLTPFVVVAISQVLGIRQAGLDLREPGSSQNTDTSFWATMAGHGIPLRAALVGLVAGSVNASITIASGAGEALPVVPIVQGFALPTLFSVLSQALSYRRARKARATLSPA